MPPRARRHDDLGKCRDEATIAGALEAPVGSATVAGNDQLRTLASISERRFPNDRIGRAAVVDAMRQSAMMAHRCNDLEKQQIAHWYQHDPLKLPDQCHHRTNDFSS